MMKVLGVIPARYNSSRLPGKPIADICGKPMIWWVYQEAIKSVKLDSVIVATDDERIRQKCEEYGMKYIMTSSMHDTPTSRLYEVSNCVDADLYTVIMGDEPLVNHRCIDLVIPKDISNQYYVAALTNELASATEVIDFSNQKVVTNSNREALFISRSPIPYPKGTLDFKYEKVTGVQVFSKDALSFYNKTKKSLIEQAEENDLMRFIENGIPVKMIISTYRTVSVDTEKDLMMVRRVLNDRLKKEVK